VIYDFFFTAQAWASAAATEHHGPTIHDIWFPLGNFLIYAFILIRFGLPLVQSFLQSRRQEVVVALEQASAKKKAAEAFLEEYRARLAGLEQEVEITSASLRQDGELLKARLLEEAKHLAEKIKEDARFLADQEFSMARRQLREEMAARAEAAARESVERHLSAADQGRLVEGFIQDIGQTR
jgi:F-type H+-transporting ATPase subunit b